MKYTDFDNRDTCLQISHYTWAKLNQKEIIKPEEARHFAEMLYNECELDTILHQRKNRTYRWSNSDGLTKWLYDNLLKYIHVDPYKGLNGDQIRALALVIYRFKKRKDKFCICENIVLGFILRLGFAPSLMEHCLFKPQAYVLLLKSYKYYYLNPLYWVSRLAFHFSMKRNLKQPIKGHTTNKISLIPTMYYLGYEIPEKSYTDAVYNRYYDGELAELMIKAVDKLRDM